VTPEQASVRVKRLGDRNGTALTLARLLSFAALAEPALIRRMRLDLLPSSTAADEADLWFSDLVQSRSPGGLVFFPQVAELLRKGLAPESAVQAWTVTREMHAYLRRAIQMEEELTYLGTAPEANQTRIQDLLGAAVSALIGGSSGLANWAGRALPRLPATVQNMEPAAALRIASDLRLGRMSDLRGLIGSASQMPAWISAVLPSLPRVRLQVSFSSREIVLGPATSDPKATLPYSIEVPDTPTIAVEVKWTSPYGPRSKILFVEKGATSQPERIDPGPVELVTLANEKWTLVPYRAGVSQKTTRPAILTAYTDGYAVALHWRSHGKIPGCLGYAITRRRRNENTGEAETESVLDSQIGFADQPVAGPSSRQPVQRFYWIDRPLRGATYSYRVTPVLGSPTAPTSLPDLASAWTPWMWVGAQQDAAITVTFNRALETAASLELTHSDILEISGSRFQSAIAQPGGRVREALGGDLLLSLISLLSQASASSQTLYAAMFEIDDPEIIQLLAQMAKRANIVLSNGGASRGKPDSNAEVRERLRHAGVTVYDRFFRAGRLAHNKFFVLCDASGEPQTVWTGNTSWVRASLCARSNAAVTVTSKPLAEAYLAYWRELVADPGQAALARWTATGHRVVQVGSAIVKAWFTPTRNLADLNDATRYVQQAHQGILFLLSEPGREGSLVTTILDQKNLFVTGVTRNGPNLTLHGKGRQSRISSKDSALPVLASLQPSERRPGPLGAPLQSRLVVIDPMSSHPVVLIGSHAFGTRGSRTNDENFLIIENDSETAQRCAAHIDACYRHYAFRSVASDTATLKLQPNDAWQDHFTEPTEQAEVAFWMGDDARTFAAPQPIDSSQTSPAATAAPAKGKAATKHAKSSETERPSEWTKAAAAKESLKTADKSSTVRPRKSRSARKKKK
jgi:phosphatidylserine/phosphatidylglycerophosphate/cardiolipin synthase-like enzyme